MAVRGQAETRIKVGAARAFSSNHQYDQYRYQYRCQYQYQYQYQVGAAGAAGLLLFLALVDFPPTHPIYSPHLLTPYI